MQASMAVACVVSRLIFFQTDGIPKTPTASWQLSLTSASKEDSIPKFYSDIYIACVWE